MTHLTQHTMKQHTTHTTHHTYTIPHYTTHYTHNDTTHHITLYTRHRLDLGKDGDGRSASGQGRVVEWDVTTAQEQLALLMEDEVFKKASPEVAFDMVSDDKSDQ